MKFFDKSPIKNLFILKKRHLSEGEKALARSVFGDALFLDEIKIIAHRMVLKDYAISPNGNVYFHKKDWCEDFSIKNISEQSWLIHELTHVWQLQQGIAVIRKALFDRRYDYILKAGKLFSQYGVEQQAQMVQDYFVQAKQGKNCDAYRECIPFLKSNHT